MNDPSLDQQLLPPPTPLKDTDPVDAPPVVEVVDSKKNKKRPLKKSPPDVTVEFTTEEERRRMRKINQSVIKKLGIKRNNSYIV